MSEDAQVVRKMSSSIDISDQTKSRLETLQAEIRETTGRDVSKQEIVDRVVEREFESREAVIESFREERSAFSDEMDDSPSDEEIEAFLSGTSDWGFETTEAEIDEVLYGE